MVRDRANGRKGGPPARSGQTHAPGDSSYACGSLSFLRHADLSPDGHTAWTKNGNLPAKTPAVTHRSDESGRVFLGRLLSSRACLRFLDRIRLAKFLCRAASDSSAGLRRNGDCAREFLLLMRPTVCFEAGRVTLTQSSRTAILDCSRKWMSGHAASALAAEEDRGQFATTNQEYGRAWGAPPTKSKEISVFP